MWLLDANLDVHLIELLRGLQIDCDPAENRGWKALRNGELVADTVDAGNGVTRLARFPISERGDCNASAVALWPLPRLL
jgi:hypothetical protein